MPLHYPKLLTYNVQAPASPVASPSTQVGGAPVYGITQLSPSATAYTGPYLSITSSAGPSSSSQKELAFPQRPGHPECQFFLRTGDCKFGATCKYHHPLELNASKNNFVLSPVGLPLRPVSILSSMKHFTFNICAFKCCNAGIIIYDMGLFLIILISDVHT